jgi:uncharacterized protein (DUF1330 family)
MSLYPTQAQLQALLAIPDDGPVVMLNLLRFRPTATAPDDGVSGEEAYQRYADRMVEFIESRGARVLYTGHVQAQVIGEGGGGFHVIALVEYPSRREFLEIATHPYVQEIGVHRSAGLEGQWLLAAKTDA